MGCQESHAEIPNENPQMNANISTNTTVPLQSKNKTNVQNQMTGDVKTPNDMLTLAKKNQWQPITDFAQQNPIQDLSDCWFEEKAIPKIPNFSVFKKLTILSLRFNNISKIQVVNLIPQLIQLYLNKNNITKIENLETLINLTHLGLSQNKITKIEGLKTLTKLQDLTLFENQIAVLEGLDTNNQINNLLIYGNKIKGTIQEKKIIQAILKRGGFVYLKSDVEEEQL